MHDMQLVELVKGETGAEYSEIMLLRHSNDSIDKLLGHSGNVEEYTALQPKDSKWDFWAKGKPRINVVVVIVQNRVFGVYRVTGVEAEGTTYSLASNAHRQFDIEREKPARPARRFGLERILCSADALTVNGWERKEISAVLRENGTLFWEIDVSPTHHDPIDVEDCDRTESELELAIRGGRLRFGAVSTSTTEAVSRQRNGQDVLRRIILANYGGRCAICDVSDPRLLRTSHIVGWAEREDSRGILTNVICLCSFHDVLFELGYWSLDDRLRVVVRGDIEFKTIRRLVPVGCSFRRPTDYLPGIEFIRHHRMKHGLKS